MGFHGKLKFCFSLVAIASTAAGIFFIYVCSRISCQNASKGSSMAEYKAGRVNYFEGNIGKEFQFDLEGNDIIVFLHMQKTGGTKFGKHLVKNLDIKHPCDCVRRRKRCDCRRPNSNEIWLFSRYSMGWPCGLHADWTELKVCVPGLINKLEGGKRSRKFLYITILREPVSRVLSELKCYQKGTTWKMSLHKCNGRVPTKEELPPCYTGENWEDVTLQEFLNCSSNLAFNRQTRMLADLELVGCYNRSAMSRVPREEILLESAKRNLASMAYFALVEYQLESQYLFERTFGMKFRQQFVQMSKEETRAAEVVPSSKDLARIQELNKLDSKLYSFAKELFFERLKYFKERDKEGISQV